jgi:hypothetical protein
VAKINSSSLHSCSIIIQIISLVMQLSRLFIFSFLLSAFSNCGVLADVSDAEQNLYAINSALSGIAQHLEALPSHSVSSEAGLVPLLLVYPHNFLIFLQTLHSSIRNLTDAVSASTVSVAVRPFLPYDCGQLFTDVLIHTRDVALLPVLSLKPKLHPS